MDQLEDSRESLHAWCTDQGETAEEIAAAKAAECEEGEKKQRYLKIVENLKDHLKSRVWLYSERRAMGRIVRADW